MRGPGGAAGHKGPTLAEEEGGGGRRREEGGGHAGYRLAGDGSKEACLCEACLCARTSSTQKVDPFS
jgi:hypothetical protein